MFLLYEDLVRSKEKTLRHLLRFLGAKTDAETIRRIDKASSFETMKQSSNQPHFFRRVRHPSNRPNFRVNLSLESSSSPPKAATSWECLDPADRPYHFINQRSLRF